MKDINLSFFNQNTSSKLGEYANWHKSPLLKKSFDSSFALNPLFENIRSDIIQIIRVAYDCAIGFSYHSQSMLRSSFIKKTQYIKNLSNHGWDLNLIDGRSAINTRFEEREISGIFGVHTLSNTLVIAFKGSISKSDWVTNLSIDKSSGVFKKYGLPDLVAHKGFCEKIQYIETNIKEKLAAHYFELLKHNKAFPSIFITGHSQGAALAHLAAIIVIDFLKTYVDASYENTECNHVQLYRLSSPMTLGDISSKKTYEAFVGVDNDIVQNGFGDIIAHDPFKDYESPLGVASQEDGSKTAFRLYQEPLKRYLGYVPSGHVALQLHFPYARSYLNAQLGYHYVNADWVFDPDLVDLNTMELLQNGIITHRHELLLKLGNNIPQFSWGGAIKNLWQSLSIKNIAKNLKNMLLRGYVRLLRYWNSL